MRAMLKVSWSERQKGAMQRERESCMLRPSVEASDVGRSANLQVEEPGVHLKINLMKSHFHMMKCNTV